jgi:hypothetical protein
MTNSPRWPILQWTERLPPDENCLYDHCVAYTPFGQFLITWKSWKTDWPTVDETPWGDYECTSSSLEKAKAACQQAMNDRLEQWFLRACPTTGPNRQAEQLLEPTLTEKIAKDMSESDIAAALPVPSPDLAQPAEGPEQPSTKGAPASSGAHSLYEWYTLCVKRVEILYTEQVKR